MPHPQSMDSMLVDKVLRIAESLRLGELQTKSCFAVLNDLSVTGRNTIDDIIELDSSSGGKHICFLDRSSDVKCAIVILESEEMFSFGRLHCLLSVVKKQHPEGIRVTLAIVNQDNSVLYYELEMGVSLPHPPDV